jgi:TPR repeat protein
VSPIDPAAESQRDREHIELMIAHSRRLMSEGYVEAARTLLERAAASRDPRAALDLGSTYDPFMLAILQVRGVAADVFLARIWYKKAIEYGSEEARKRLELLAYPRLRDAEPVVVARQEIPRVERGTAATAAVMAIAPAKPKSRVLRLPNEVRTSRDERDQRCSVHCLLDATPPWLN